MGRVQSRVQRTLHKHWIKREDKSSLESTIKCYSRKNYQVLVDCLIIFKLEELDIGKKEEDPFEECLTMASCAIQCAFHKTHGHSPGQLYIVFGHDMFMPISVPIDWDSIREQKQKAISKSNERENSKRILIQYQRGDYITLQKPSILRKLSVPRLGPYKVLKHHMNGDIPFEKSPNVTDKANICQVYPYYKKNSKEAE